MKNCFSAGIIILLFSLKSFSDFIPTNVSVDYPNGGFIEMETGACLGNQISTQYWISVPEKFEEEEFYFWQVTNPGVEGHLYGKTEFTVLEDSKIWLLALYGLDDLGGNSYGNWMPEVVTEEELLAQGWEDTGYEFIAEKWDKAYQHPYTLFSRNCKKGETFTYRTRKYCPPRVMVKSVPEPSVVSMVIVSLIAITACCILRSRKGFDV